MLSTIPLPSQTKVLSFPTTTDPTEPQLIRDITNMTDLIDFKYIKTTSSLFEELRNLLDDYRTPFESRKSAQNFIYVLFITKLSLPQRKSLEFYVSEMIDCSHFENFNQKQEELVFWGEYPVIRNLTQVKEFIKLIDDERGVKIFEFIKALSLKDDLKEFDYQLGLGKRDRDGKGKEVEDDEADGTSTKRSRRY
ncbi:hypothetical protein WICPIJ_001835 [Wickerhamomyces pijperi]|uniref:Uncharacterized protein n=1 Tax=Wickerhamomyces pijperi TaxID=599730 RepID=A0A9P8QAY4_WICPI|nr:hypothetical protein WICPIJ_001835 [Wickerhamomyces pijperi]